MTRTVLLGDVCSYVTEKVSVNDVELVDYVSTENLIADKGGLSLASNLPQDGKVTKFQEADVLVSNIRPYFKKIWHADREGGASNDVLVFRPTTDNLTHNYLYYVLKNDRFFDFSTTSSGGSKMPRGDKAQIMKYPVYLPDLETQKKITNILGTIDEKIELNRQMNETLEKMGQALFRHCFIDNPKAKKWNTKSIGELCDVKIGRTPPRKESEWFDKGDGEVWVSIKDMGQGMTFISDSSEYLTEEAVARFNVPAIEPDTLLLSFKLTVGRLCISTKRMYSNEAIAQLPLKSDETSTEYLYHFLRNFNFNQLSSTSSIATAVNSTTVKNIEVIIPGRTVMVEFTEQSRTILEMIKDNAKQIQTLTALRDTLLPRLINGRVKV